MSALFYLINAHKTKWIQRRNPVQCNKHLRPYESFTCSEIHPTVMRSCSTPRAHMFYVKSVQPLTFYLYRRICGNPLHSLSILVSNTDKFKINQTQHWNGMTIFDSSKGNFGGDTLFLKFSMTSMGVDIKYWSINFQKFTSKNTYNSSI